MARRASRPSPRRRFKTSASGRLAKLVTAGGDPELSDAFGESPAKLKITLKSGEAFEHRRDYATGSKPVPMTQAQVEAKFTTARPRR